MDPTASAPRSAINDAPTHRFRFIVLFLLAGLEVTIYDSEELWEGAVLATRVGDSLRVSASTNCVNHTSAERGNSRAVPGLALLRIAKQAPAVAPGSSVRMLSLRSQ